jgi:hypothetical protein
MDNKKGKNYAVVDLSGEFKDYISADNTDISGSDVILLVEDESIPVSQISLRYNLNAIPEATVIVALGRNVKNQNRSNIYGKITAIKQMAKIKILIKGKLGDWSPVGGLQWPEVKEGAIIFMGYVSGLSYRRTSGRVSLVINAISKIIDLAMSSGGSKDVVPGSPADLLLPTLTDEAGVTGSAAGTADTKFAIELEKNTIEDFSKAVLTCLVKLSKTNFIQLNNLVWCPGSVPPNNTADNTRASNVIEGIDEWLGIANYSTKGKITDYVKSYKFSNNVPSFAVAKACLSISRYICNSLASTSMWGMIVGKICAEFGCGIIPMARAALFAPILPMARQHQITVYPEDYVDFNFSCMAQTPLYGFGVIVNYQFFTIGGTTEKASCIGPTYVAKDNKIVDGMYMFGQAPSWIDDWTNTDPNAAKNPAVVSMTSSVSNTTTGNTPNNSVKRNLTDEAGKYDTALHNYAKMMYASNALRAREGVIVGKLRFDIAPGITIKIQSKSQNEDEGFNGVDDLAVPLIGFVAKVTITIDAEQAAASTSIELTNLRTEAENKEDRFSMTTHPFFSNYFEYAPIVPELSLPPTRD